MTAASIRGLSESEDDRAFLQRRVALFSRVIGGSYLLFWIYRLITLLLFAPQEALAHPSFWWHLAAAGFFLLPWLLCRGRERSARFISLTEITALSLGVLATSVMAIYIPMEERPDFIMLLALTNVILARSIFVPCTGRRTLMLGIIFGTVLLSCVYVVALGLNLEKWSTLHPELSQMTTAGAALGITMEIAVWWVLTTALATGTSFVIYGLRRRVRDAEQLGQYRLEEKIGEGGMGAVYRARHAFLRRPTAVKLLPPEKAGADNLRRFEQEVQLTASLTHPNTITIFDYGHTSDGIFYYAMEYVDGLILSDLVARSGPQDPGRVIDLMRQTASALVEAHGIGLVHRDVKPSNIMVHLLHPHGGAGDCVKVLDFGLVKEVRQEGGIDLTNEANVSGTPQYMAPEAITTPNSVDARADLYALGAVAYYLLTGTHLFTGQSIVEVCSHHLHSTPEPLSSRLGKPIAPDLEQLVLSCLEKDPSDRPQSAFELEQRLSQCANGSPWTSDDARRWWAAYGEPSPSISHRDDERVLTIDLQLTSRADWD
ncbi:MAG: serine/threonine protein kinase [Deltaproteobacteria bacterium]|nr:serine/threonine protein kinase [Deltaproteobacteria bacterium]MBW2718008.1 serine/threonine protein kinase [Deltaproteobacteria bacterium]